MGDRHRQRAPVFRHRVDDGDCAGDDTGDAAQTVVDDLDLDDKGQATVIQQELIEEEKARAPADLRWTLAFVITLSAIHIARMQPDGSLLGVCRTGCRSPR